VDISRSKLSMHPLTSGWRPFDDAHKSNYICALLQEARLMAHINIDLDEKLLTEAMALTREPRKK